MEPIVVLVAILVAVIGIAILLLRGFDKIANRDHQAQTKKITKELRRIK